MSSIFPDNKRPPIVLTEDIIQQWVKRTGKDEEVLRDIFKHHLDYLYSKVKDEKSLVLIVPRLGKLRLNYLLACSRYSYSNKNPNTWLINKINLLKKLFEEGEKEIVNFSRPMIFLQMKNLTKKYTKYIIPNFYKMWITLEEWNNEIVDKKT